MKKRLPLVLLAVAASAGLVYAGYSLTRTPPDRNSVSAGPDFGRDTSDSKTYENKDSRFSFSYPAAWVLESGADSVTFSNPGDLSEEISIAVSEAKYLAVISGSFSNYSSQTVELDGATGVRYYSGQDPLRAVLAVRGRNLYYISGKSDRFDELLLGFKFLK